MDVLESLLHLIAFLFRCVVVLFDLLDVLQLLHGIVSFVADLMSSAWASMPWVRRKPKPKVEAPVSRPRRMATEPTKQF